MRIEYSFDGPKSSGRRRAQAALPLLGKQFFVLYGDSYLPIDYSRSAAALFCQRKPGLMTVFRNEGGGTRATSSSMASKSVL